MEHLEFGTAVVGLFGAFFVTFATAMAYTRAYDFLVVRKGLSGIRSRMAERKAEKLAEKERLRLRDMLSNSARKQAASRYWETMSDASNVVYQNGRPLFNAGVETFGRQVRKLTDVKAVNARIMALIEARQAA